MFIYVWLCWRSTLLHEGLSLVASGGYSLGWVCRLLICSGFSCAEHGLQGELVSVVGGLGLSSCFSLGLLELRLHSLWNLPGSNLCPLDWLVDSLPLSRREVLRQWHFIFLCSVSK